MTGGNPLITMAERGPAAGGVREARAARRARRLPNETASLAHYVLPCTRRSQRPDLPFIFPLMLGLQTQALPAGDATSSCRRRASSATRRRSTSTSRAPAACRSSARASRRTASRWRSAWHSRRHPDEQPALPQEALLSLLLRVDGPGQLREAPRAAARPAAPPHHARRLPRPARRHRGRQGAPRAAPLLVAAREEARRRLRSASSATRAGSS